MTCVRPGWVEQQTATAAYVNAIAVGAYVTDRAVDDMAVIELKAGMH
jgi:uncharacterized membrane protein